jgi:hypothetical protein
VKLFSSGSPGEPGGWQKCEDLPIVRFVVISKCLVTDNEYALRARGLLA